MRHWEDKTEAIWGSLPVSILLCVIAVGVASWASYSLPSPGTSIGILGGVAAIMTLRGNMRTGEKIVWILIITALMGAEIRSITKNDQLVTADRNAQNLKLEALNRESRAIVSELKTAIENSQKQFDTTMSGINTTLIAADQIFRQTQTPCSYRDTEC